MKQGIEKLAWLWWGLWWFLWRDRVGMIVFRLYRKKQIPERWLKELEA